MPGGDRMGPDGMGPMTGRAAGYCAGLAAPGSATARGARGSFGLGRGGRGGGGRGWRNRFFATGLFGWQRAAAADDRATGPALGADQQLDILKGQAERLQGDLDTIRQRIDRLEKDSSAS